MIKISFLGDIMCEGPFLRAAQTGPDTYRFEGAFDGIKDFLTDSDFVVGNLETPVAGRGSGYTKAEDMYSFNTPSEFVHAVKNLGVDLLLTANNHCFDRGLEGLLKTLDTLDECGIAHTGTYREKGDTVFRKMIADVSISVISCTAETNSEITGETAKLKNVNLLARQNGDRKKEKKPPLQAGKQFLINDVIGLERYMEIRKKLGKSPLSPTTDNRLIQAEADRYIDRIIRLIEAEKKLSDYVFVCPHMGGQFNVRPGRFSEYVMEKLTLTNVDAVIASHPHILQKIQVKNGKPCFYSIGNVTMSMGTKYIIRENYPDIGAIVNIYLDKDRPVRYTYTLIKEVEDERGFIRVSLLYDLIRNAEGEKKEKLLREYEYANRLLQTDVKAEADGPVPEVELWGKSHV